MESIKNIQKMVDTAKQDAIKLAKELAEMVEALKPLGLADVILTDKEFKKYTAVLVPKPTWTPPETPNAGKPSKVGKTGKRAKRGSRAEEILAILGDKQLGTGDINRELKKKSANLSAVLAGLKKASKIGKTGDKWHKA